MKTSVIISTYNNGLGIDACVRSVLRNNFEEFEIIFADDGTNKPESLKRLEKWCSTEHSKIYHAQQEDRGFRLARSRNNAVRYSSGDILLFLDHDIILPRSFADFLARTLVPGWYVAGRRVKLDEEISRQILSGERNADTSFSMKFAFEAWRRNLPGWRYLLPLRNRLPGKRSQNFQGMAGFCIGIYRDDFMAVDGFDNCYERYGVEDWDFMARCNNCGIGGGYLPRKATVLHLWHHEKPHDLQGSDYKRLNEVVEHKIKLPRSGYSSMSPLEE